MLIKGAGFGDGVDRNLASQPQNKDDINVNCFEEVLSNPEANPEDIKAAANLLASIADSGNLEELYSDEMLDVLTDVELMDE